MQIQMNLRLHKVTVFSKNFRIFSDCVFSFRKNKSKVINELSRHLHSIYSIKHYIITLFFDYHEFELEITR